MLRAFFILVERQRLGAGLDRVHLRTVEEAGADFAAAGQPEHRPGFSRRSQGELLESGRFVAEFLRPEEALFRAAVDAAW